MFVQLVSVSEDRIFGVRIVFTPHILHLVNEIELSLELSHGASLEVIVDGMAQSIVETRIQREVFVRECGRPSTCHSGSQIAHHLAVERINDAVSIDVFPANISRFDGFPAC